jgi:hypothetical protein
LQQKDKKDKRQGASQLDKVQPFPSCCASEQARSPSSALYPLASKIIIRCRVRGGERRLADYRCLATLKLIKILVSKQKKNKKKKKKNSKI